MRSEKVQQSEIPIYLKIIEYFIMLHQAHLLRNQQQSVKHRLFRFFHQAVLHHSVQNHIFVIFLLIEFVQLLNYCIHYSYMGLWNTPTLTYLQTALSYCDLGMLWRVTDSSALLVFAIVGFLSYLIATLFIAYQILKDSKKAVEPNIIAVKYISWLAILTKTVLFLPFTMAFLAFIVPSNFNINNSLQIPLAMVSVMGLLLLFFNSYIFILFYRDNSPFVSLPFASSVNENEEIRMLIKFLAAIYGCIINSESGIGVQICSIYAILLAFLVVNQYKKYGYLKFPFNRLMEIGPVILLWVCLCSIYQQIFTTTEVSGLFFCFVGSLLIPFIWIEVHSNRMNFILNCNYKTLTSSTQLLIYNFECIRLVNHYENMNNLILLEGLLNFHMNFCKKSAEQCVCWNIREKMSSFTLQSDKSEILSQKKLWFQFIKSNLSDIKQKFQSVAQISFLLAYIEKDQLSNKYKALHNLQEPSHFNSGLKFEFLNYNYLRKIQSFMVEQDRLNNEKKPVDINRYYNFEINFGTLQQLIQESTYDHLRFWQNLKSQKATQEKLFLDGQKINKKLDAIKELYEKMTVINPCNIHCLILFSNYMKVIVNNPEIFQKNSQTINAIKNAFANSSKISNDIQKEKYGDNSVSGIVIISGQRKNIGIIKHCTTKITELISYAPHQLLGQNINILMPKFIGSMHDDVLRNYLELSQSKYDYIQRLAPMIDKNNYLVFARILTKPLPSLLNGLELVGIFNLVSEFHINHPGQTPKYVLYRSDTGQVQALSQNCYTQFHYKINKIDEFNQTTSDLSFDTLFLKTKESDITTDDQGVKSYILPNNSYDQSAIVPIDVYGRLQIIYYGVKLRLLYFFTLKSYQNIEKNVSPVHTDMNTKHNNTERPGKQEKQMKDKVLKEKFLHEMTKKQSVITNEPTAYKILKKFGIAYFLIVSVLSIVYVVLNIQQSSSFAAYLSICSLGAATIGDIAQINFFSRLMHLSHYYPTILTEYSSYKNNISISISSLQDKQFQIANHMLGLSSSSTQLNSTALSWTINQNGQITSVNETNDANVFDYITSASSFKGSNQSNLNFSLMLLSNKTNSSAYIDFFHIRYTGLFQTIMRKISRGSQVQSYFLSNFSVIDSQVTIKLTVICVFLLISAAVMIPLTISLIKAINDTIILFGHMNKAQVDRQIENCNTFLEIFYKNSYNVLLKKKQINEKNKNGFIELNSFSVDEVKLQKVPQGQNRIKQVKETEQSLSLAVPIPSMNTHKSHKTIVMNVNRIQNLQKQLLMRTENQMPNLGSQNQAEALNKQNQQQQNAIYEHLSKQEDTTKYKIIILIIIFQFVVGAYFIIENSLNSIYKNQTINEISNYKIISENINKLKTLKLYTLESIVDNSQFQTYALLNQTAATEYSYLYQHQQNLDILSLSSDNTAYSFQFYNSNICDPSALSTLSSIANLKIFTSNSFDSTQCVSLFDGILTNGLRVSIVGYAETLINMTLTLDINKTVNNPQFLEAIKMQKYLQAPLINFQNSHSDLINSLVEMKLLVLVLSLCGFLLAFVIGFFCVWKPTLDNMYSKLKTTRQILGFIPVRVFLKNARLAKQYENYISNLLE